MHFSESSPNINQMLAQRADGEIILRLVELSDADEFGNSLRMHSKFHK